MGTCGGQWFLVAAVKLVHTKHEVSREENGAREETEHGTVAVERNAMAHERINTRRVHPCTQWFLAWDYIGNQISEITDSYLITNFLYKQTKIYLTQAVRLTRMKCVLVYLHVKLQEEKALQRRGRVL